MAQKFRTRIVEIEATQFTGENWTEMWEWTSANFRFANTQGTFTHEGQPITAEVFDKLHNAWIGVAPGQWIVRGVKGEYYPCDDETFHWKYEEIFPAAKVAKPAKCPYEGKHQGNVVFSEGDTCSYCGWTL